MELVIDASSIINLCNAGALSIVVNLQRCRLWVSPLVVGECEPTCAAEITSLKEEGLLHFVSGDQIPADQYLELLEEYELGEGETECIALCVVAQYHICCDDNRARQVAGQTVGDDRVIGSLRLLRWSVEEGLISSAEAYAYYLDMRNAGGFLPDVEQAWFDP